MLTICLSVIAAPLAALAMLVVKLTSRGPAIYSQTRIGLDGREFTIYKIRTMIHDCESLTGPRWCVPGDSRVTPIGRILRKLHIDELPQLVNVFRGDMSLVGPRPERPEFVEMLSREIDAYPERHCVLPGITGLAQLHLPPDVDVADVERKLVYDLDYTRRIGLWLDLRIIVATGLKLLAVPSKMIHALVPAVVGVEPTVIAFPTVRDTRRAA
jgi:lipopolysaccharide/colanic/teichoic acid biosynthesis glycosyltransferase